MKYVIVMVIAFSVMVLLFEAAPPEVVIEVQKGVSELSCEFQDGWRKVEDDKIVDLIEGEWIFTNGSASNCVVDKTRK